MQLRRANVQAQELADSFGVHLQSVKSLLKGHVHPIDVDVAEHAVGMSVELIVAGTKTSVPVVGDGESLVMFADGELEKLSGVTVDVEAESVGSEELPVATGVGASVSFADGEAEKLIVGMNNDTGRTEINVPVSNGVVVFVVNVEEAEEEKICLFGKLPSSAEGL